MKVDRSKAKRSSTEVPPDCKVLIDKLKGCSDYVDLCFVLEKVPTWTYGKCELYHWIDVLDMFDLILEEACEKCSPNTWVLRCDMDEFQVYKRDKMNCLTLVLRFTTMLIEHSFSRHLYNSMEHLTALLASELPELVLDVLNLIYMFSKRSNFLSRLLGEKKDALLERLTYLAESWGGRDAGFGVAACCLDKPITDFPDNATTVHLEFTNAPKTDTPSSGSRIKQSEVLTIIHIDDVDRLECPTSVLMDNLCEKYKIPADKQMLLFTRLRLAKNFTTYYRRVMLVQLRLQALSVLVYANAVQDNMHQLLYTGLLEELVELVGCEDPRLDNTKATALRCLTAIIHLDRGQSFPNTIIEITGANSFHGFLPKMVRTCITALLLPEDGSPYSDVMKRIYPFHLATALFSFVYHLSSFEPGGEALVSCGMMESLLRVINWKSTEVEHITFVTRAVRVIDLITNMDMQSFHMQDGLGIFLTRLQVEVSQCRKEQPFEIGPDVSPATRLGPSTPRNSDQSTEDISETVLEPQPPTSEVLMDTDSNSLQEGTIPSTPSPTDLVPTDLVPTDLVPTPNGSTTKLAAANGVTCLPQRAALLKSMFNFLKKVIQDPAFSDGIRHLVETPFPSFLKHIISNAEYYGASLFLLATDIVTVTVFQEPSILSTLQDMGLTDVVQEALLVKDVPATREVIASLPNVFSALCLNSRGLASFVRCKPFTRIFKVLISPEYLSSMRRRRTAETFGDTASNLGNAMDELMRHQPSLKVEATSAMVKLLEDLCKMGRDPKYSCWKPQVKPTVPPINNANTRNGTSEGGSSDDDDEDEEEASAASHNAPARGPGEDGGEDPIPPTSSYMSAIVSTIEEKAPVPLVDYISNVMKFVDAILSNNSTDDHCREFVSQKGLEPLMEVLALPNLPIDFPNSQACMSVASVCKSILNLAHEAKVLQEGMTSLEKVLVKLERLNSPVEGVGSSVLLRELAKAEVPLESIGNPHDTPILNAITSAHAYIMMFVHVCRTGQSDIRAMSVTNWGSPQGVRVLKSLSQLYLNLVWESTVLLAFCTGEFQPGPNEFGREDLDRLIPREPKAEPTEVSIKGGTQATASSSNANSNDVMEIDIDSNASSSNGVTQESSSTVLVSSATQTGGSNQKTAERGVSPATLQSYSKLLKPILSASSRLGRALAELFGLLVKLCVGSPIRQRRGHQMPTVPGFATPGSSAVAKLLAELLTDGLKWEPRPNSPVPRLTFSICAVGFSAPLLFDDKKFSYHLMLRKFTNSSGLKSLFNLFYWAISKEAQTDNKKSGPASDPAELSDQQVEFLDCWLTLVEKICNPKTVLESPHTYPVKTAIRQLSLFDSGHFLTYAHKLAFHAMMHLWNRKSLKLIGTRAAELMLTILGHIIRHKEVEERTASAKIEEDKNVTATSTGGTSARGTQPRDFDPLDVPSRVRPPPLDSPPLVFPFPNDDGVDADGRMEMVTVSSQANLETVPVPTLAEAETPQDPIPNENASTDIANVETEVAAPTETSTESAVRQGVTDSNIETPNTNEDQNNGNANQTPETSTSTSAVPAAGTAPRSTNPLATSSVEGAMAAAEALGVDYAQLQQLADMGFPLEMCIEALISTNSVIHATDYLLNNGGGVGAVPFRRTAAPTPAAAPAPTARRGHGPMDWEYNDDEQMLRALALSLGDHSVKISNLVGAKVAAEKQSWKPPETLSAEEINAFTDTILPRSLTVVDQLPECVFRIGELLVAIGQRSGVEWMGKILNTLVEQIVSALIIVQKVASESSKPLEDLCEGGESEVLSIRIHLFSLMFEELKTMCAYLLEKWEVIDPAIHLLELLHQAHQNFPNSTATTPKWLAPLVLMIDLYEKSAIATRRRAQLAEETDHLWKWFDINSGKWCAYSTANNNNIDKAFWEGESSLRIMAGRRRYVINFSGMIQLNEETSNRRPIALWLKSSKKEDVKAAGSSKSLSPTTNNVEMNGETSDTDNSMPSVSGGDIRTNSLNNFENEKRANLRGKQTNKSEKMDTHENQAVDDLKKKISLLRGLNEKQVLSLMRSSVGFMDKPVNPDALHALMRLCLRVTRDHPVAVTFAQFGGVRSLVNLNLSSGFQGFLPLANLLIRHVLEDPACLRYAIEKMIRAKAISTSASTCKELHYLLRVLAPVACRSPSLFVEVAKDILRVDINFVTRRGLHSEDDLRLIVKPLPCKPENFKTYMGVAAQDVIHQLLRALLHPADEVSMDTGSPSKSAKDSENETQKRQRLIPKFAIFQLLAESVHSYSYSCKIIAEYCFQGGSHQDIPEDCTALAFLLDRMLPSNQYIGQVDCHNLVKDLLAAMAGCNHLPEAQIIIISEVKAALQRAVALKEGIDKHCRIQCLANLISHMIESCPSAPPTQMVTAIKTTQFCMNSVVRLLIKKNVVVDLTRIPLHLDLTSRFLAGTTNAVLKALELITRIVNQPAANNASRPKPPKTEQNTQDSVNITHTGGTSNSEGTHAQGEETVEDADNTEHDISAAAESLDPTSESHTQEHEEHDPTEEGDEGVLEEIMDQLLDRDSSQRTEDQILAEAMIGDSQTSRMDTDAGEGQRLNADYEEDHDHNDTSDSDSDPSDEGEEEGEEGEEEEDDEDDDDDDDDDEDGGSNFDDNEQGFMEEGFIRFPAMDRDDEMLMVQYGGEPENAPIFFTNNTSYNFNMGLFDDPLISEHSSGLRVTHPLLAAPTTEPPASGAVATRGHRTGRQRRYQYFQYINPRHAHPPAILQRLLGPSTAQEVITLTTGQALNPGIRDARLLVMDSAPVRTTDQDVAAAFSRNGLAAGPSSCLANYTALHWWCEEAKALDGESMHDCVTAVKREIIETVEEDRDQIFKLRREKRVKDLEESKKKKEMNDTANVSEVAQRATHSHGANLQSNIEDSFDDVPDLVALSRRIPHRPIHIVREERHRLADPQDPDVSDSESDISIPPLTDTLDDAPGANDSRNGPSNVRDSHPQGQGQEADDELFNVRDPVTDSLFNQDDGMDRMVQDGILLPNLHEIEDSSDSNQDIFEPSTVSGAAAQIEDENRVLMGVLEGLEALTPSPVNTVNALSGERTIIPESPPTEPVAGPSGAQLSEDFRNILGDIEVPDGVDPSFLAALPEDMRQEVIAEHLRQQRQRQRSQNPVVETATVNVMDVSPEFLAALPPNIQEEVLAQQRIEQQRRVATAGNPNDPVDAEAFFRNLQPSLRQAILSDMEESQIAVLPPELVTEAQNLRRDWESRNRQLLQDRFFTHSNANASTTLSSILRNSGMRLNSRYALHNIANRPGPWTNGWTRPPTALVPHTGAVSTKVKGKQLVDHETLSCLLIMLFVDDPKINTGKLHRVLRNLCYHTSTRQWVIRSLLSIMERSSECKLLPEPEPMPKDPQPFPDSNPSKAGEHRQDCISMDGLEFIKTQPPTWLNIRLDAGLGSQANVFQIEKLLGTGKKGGSDLRHISIHPQAINQISRHVLDVLSNLAKSFPCHFLPSKLKTPSEPLSDTPVKKLNTDKETSSPDKCRNASTSSSSGKSKFQHDGQTVDFFDILLKLDSVTSGRKGKSLAKLHATGSGMGDPSSSTVSFEESSFGQLISMLAHSFVRRSSILTDKLLRLLSLISLGIPETSGYGRKVLLEEPEIPQEESTVISESHLRLIIEVITSKSCSDEGLEEATALLLNLSYGPPSAREKILTFLMEGVRELGNVIGGHIGGLICELKKVNSTLETKTESKETAEEPGPSSSQASDQEPSKKALQGTLTDRFTKEPVVVSATKGKMISCELQLPSMGPLTSKTSSQAFFLRLLKVVISLRDAIRVAIKRHKQKVAGETPQAARLNDSTPLPVPASAPVEASSGDADVQSMEVDNQENVTTAESPARTSASSSDLLNSNGASENTTDGPKSSMYQDKCVGGEEKKDGSSTTKPAFDESKLLPRLSSALSLENLWNTLSECLLELGHTPDHHAVLVLQPAVEAFFLVHSSSSEREDKKTNVRETREAQLAHLQEELPPVSPNVRTENLTQAVDELLDAKNSLEPANLTPDTLKFLSFAETHRTVLNQILRQSTAHLADGPFSVLVDHTRVLDFDVKRRYCRTELERLDEGVRREDLAVHVRRSHVFEDSFRELQRRSSEEWKNRFYIVFEGEEGQDAGGLLREWYMIISREIFNPMYALFTVSPGDRVTYMINPSSHCNPNHLFYFKFVGRVIAKAIYDNKLLECYFTRSFYKHILGKYVKHSDMESEDYSFYQGLAFLMDNNVSELGYDLTLSTEVQEFGVTEVRDLVPNGRNIAVTEENKMEYIRLVCQMKMTGAIQKQLNAFLEGFYDIIPKRLISIFNEQELELLVSGLPNVDIEDLKSNTEYHKYQPTSLQIQWFWRALRSFDHADRAKFLQFVTGTSKVPLQGFEALEGMNGVQKFQIHRDDRSTDRLPSAHTCFNQLDLPAYETYDKLRTYLLKAIHECSEGFGFA